MVDGSEKENVIGENIESDMYQEHGGLLVMCKDTTKK